MAIQKIARRILCSHCQKPMVIAGIATTKADPHGQLLAEINQALELNGLCPDCQKLYNHAVDNQRRGNGTDFRVKIVRIVGPEEEAA